MAEILIVGKQVFSPHYGYFFDSVAGAANNSFGSHISVDANGNQLLTPMVLKETTTGIKVGVHAANRKLSFVDSADQYSFYMLSILLWS